MIIGAFLLMLPNSTYSGIGVVDALFTSTSAVCVTGLAVVDTGTHFTQTGLIIIALLIQIGGLGILTFTSYFSYFFKGGSTFESQLLLRDMVNVGKMSEVFSVLKRIIGVTFVVEAVGALLVFLFLEKTMLPVLSDRVFFAIFHAISGFCNAGFSTLSGGLYEPVIRFNYPVHLIIAFLFILGGMGFPIVFNTVKFLKGKLLNLLYWLFFHQKRFLSPWVLNLNSRVVLYMTFIMIFLGTFLFFILEYSNTLSEHSFFGKIVTAFFNSVTTRTAGFNTIDFSQISIFTVMVVLFLMWVGASPASTGGGIKTSTLAVAVLNIRSLVIGRNKLEVFNRQISQTTINRSYAIIVLSIVMIWMATFLLALFDGAKGMLNLFFETVSAFSTVGLSRGITPSLSIPGKFILILTMFVGRVSMLTLLIAVFKKVANINYRYPDEEILIN
jgi:potassium uptake TrkH family protein